MKSKNAVSAVYFCLSFFILTIFYFGISKKYFFKDKGQRYRPKLTAIANIPMVPVKFRPVVRKYAMVVDKETKEIRENKVSSMSSLSEE